MLCKTFYSFLLNNSDHKDPIYEKISKKVFKIKSMKQLVAKMYFSYTFSFIE